MERLGPLSNGVFKRSHGRAGGEPLNNNINLAISIAGFTLAQDYWQVIGTVWALDLKHCYEKLLNFATAVIQNRQTASL